MSPSSTVQTRRSELRPPDDADRTTLPARTPKGVVLRVVRSAMAVDWVPFRAAEELIAYVDGDVRLLQIAYARIQSCVTSTCTVIQARSLATLKVAITRLDEQQGRR